MLFKLYFSLFFVQYVFCGVLDQFKDVMDVSYECSAELSGEENVELLKTVDCNLPEARWDFKIIVSNIFYKCRSLKMNSFIVDVQWDRKYLITIRG